MIVSALYVLFAVFATLVHSLSSTDEIQDADVPQSGYLPNHGMDPAKLNGYTIPWTKVFNPNEVFYAKPLVYTPSGSSSELVILVSSQNLVRVLDGATGAVLYSRTLLPPFQSVDSACGDIPNTVGITGTPIIDPATELMYLYAKGYKGGIAGPAGTINGEYKLYALKLPGLQDAPGFPVSIEGKNANNDRSRYIIGGTILQRPSLVSVGNTIVAGFGGHCDNFNYTGMLVAVSKTTGVGVTNVQAMVAAPGAPSPQPTDIQVQNGGKSGIWQSGMGLAVDAPNNRVFFVTGNGRGAGVNGANIPVSGKVPISTLEQVVADFSVDGSTGALEQKDYFMPWDYDQLNGGDRDFGSSGVALLDPNPFSGGGVQRIAIAAGKNGKVYIMDADNLGGFKNGAGGGDGVLQIISTATSFFGGIGSYPLEGGYIYFCPTGDSLYAYKLGFDGSGKPTFNLAGKSSMVFAGKGIPTITSLGGKPGTGIVWLADVNQGLVAYNAVPVNGVLQPISLPPTGRLGKSQRPAFGNTRVYTTAGNKIFMLAGPGAPPPASSLDYHLKAVEHDFHIQIFVKIYFNVSNIVESFNKHILKPVSHFKQTLNYINKIIHCINILKAVIHPSIVDQIFHHIRAKFKSSSTAPAPTIPAGKLRTFNWNITWVRASPDGFARPFVGINNQWPCPSLDVNIGDTIKLNIYNGLGNESTAIHFHGLFQQGTTYADGPAWVTQCPIPPGESFVYQFRLLQSGTYWYHAHLGGQYIDGLRGPLIVRDASAPYKVDQEVTLTLSDLYHQEAPYLVNYFLSTENTDLNGGAEPVPNTALINEAQNVKFPIVPGKTYLFRIINIGALAALYLQFDQHTMTIVEVDGVYTQPRDVNQLFVGVAQRYAVIIKAKATAAQNFAIVASMNTNMFGSTVTPPNQQSNVTAWLVYDATKALPAPFVIQTEPFDDAVLVPYDQQALLDPATYTIYLTASFGPNNQGSTRGTFNGVTYVHQKVPTLYTALTAPANVVNNPAIYGANSIPYVLPYGAVVEINVNNHDDRAHPFHLHGHNFQVIQRADGGPKFPGLYSTPAIPMRRDVVIIYGGGSAVIRFKADNPGINLFHCHTEWHVESGLTATFIEAPAQLQASKPYIPVSHREVCDNHGILRQGNAAGNKKDWLNLAGANTEPPLNNWGAMVNPPN